jgi:hypothetical protein
MEVEVVGDFPSGRREFVETVLVCARIFLLVLKCAGDDDSLRGDVMCLAAAEEEAFDAARETTFVEGTLLCFRGEENLSLEVAVLYGGVEDRDRTEASP